MGYKIDRKIDLTGICVAANWHLQSVIEALVGAGVEQHRTRVYQTRLSALSALYQWAYGAGVLQHTQ